MYYFLDIDGVLNTKADWSRPFTVTPVCMANFAELLRADDDPHIILSSSWRQGLSNKGDHADTGSLFKEFTKLGLKIAGATPVSNKTRQEEIEYYIRRNGVSEYLILGDDERLFPRPKEVHIYLTDYRAGLTAGNVKGILKMKKKGIL